MFRTWHRSSLIGVPLLVVVLLTMGTCDFFSPEPGSRTTPFGSPDLILHNGQVITMEGPAVVQALAIKDEIIVEVGSDTQIMELRTPETRVIDLGGLTLMPGFVDPHNHVYNAVVNGQHPDQVGTTYAEAQERLIRAGTTTVANGNIWEDALQDFLLFVNEGGLRIRTSVYLGYNNFCGGEWPDGWYLAYPPVRDPTAMFRIPGVKFFADGGACRRGAFSFYADGGDLYFTATELAPLIAQVQQQGYQALIHALGDIAVDSVLAALETALGGGPNVHRHRMDHNRYLQDRQLARYSEVGAYPVVFGSPFTCPILDGGAWSFLMGDLYAPLRPRLDPWRALLDANPGHRVAWKSDAPSHWPLEPLSHLWSLATRNERRPDGSVCEAPDWLKAGAVTVAEALRMMTIDAAYVLWMDSHVGSLAEGKLADLIILSGNPLNVPVDEIPNLEVLLTMVGGKVEHCASDHTAFCP